MSFLSMDAIVTPQRPKLEASRPVARVSQSASPPIRVGVFGIWIVVSARRTGAPRPARMSASCSWAEHPPGSDYPLVATRNARGPPMVVNVNRVVSRSTPRTVSGGIEHHGISERRNEDAPVSDPWFGWIGGLVAPVCAQHREKLQQKGMSKPAPLVIPPHRLRAKSRSTGTGTVVV